MSEKTRKIIAYVTVAAYLLLSFGPAGAKPYRQIALIVCAIILSANSLVYYFTNKTVSFKQEGVWQAVMLAIVIYAVLCLVGVIPSV